MSWNPPVLSPPCPSCGDRGPKQIVPAATRITTTHSRGTGAASILLCLLFPPLLIVWGIVAIIRVFAGGRRSQVVPITTPEQHRCLACGATLVPLRYTGGG